MSDHRLTPLAWDSEFLGFPVARIEEPDLDDEGLSAALRKARGARVRLVYWAAPGGRGVPEALLREFAGVLADRRATYSRDLASPTDAVAGPGVVVEDYPRGPASPWLNELAVTAGAHSRFRRDPLFPPERFRALYRTWIHRCAVGELADAVLVAWSPGEGLPLGMVTLSVRDGLGQIGLIAVAESARGRGVGARLIGQAHERMRLLGARRAAVVTQLDNAPACRLYENMGYRLDESKTTYHFWPLSAPEPAAVGAVPAGATPEPGRGRRPLTAAEQGEPLVRVTPPV